MHLAQEMLLEFHKKMRQRIGDPRKPDVSQEQAFRLKLLNEELKELQEALDAGDVVKTADGLADAIYVLVGCAVTWGIDLAEVFSEVHRSNMSKDPGNASTGGKAIKGAKFSPADVAGVLKDAADNFDCSDDGWWLEPTPGQCLKCGRGKSKSAGCDDGTCTKGPRHEIIMYDPSKVTTDNIMAAAKDQAKLLAMKSIKADFVTVAQSDENYPLADPTAWEAKHAMPAEMIPALSIKGQMTSYGAWVFSCPCGRTHAVQGKLGTRGGLAPKGKAECMCGKAFVVDFTTAEPQVEVTTIEEMRKADV